MISPVFAYESCRELLKAVLESEKTHFATPHKVLAQSLGLSSPHLSMILEGKRHLSFLNLLKLSEKLKCSEEEFSFLETLFLFESAKSDEEKKFYESRLRKFKEKVKVTPTRTVALTKISHWHILPLFVYITDFTTARTTSELFEKCKHLCPSFDISEAQLMSDLQLLSSMGVLNFTNEDKIHLRFDKLTGEFSQVKFMQSLVSKALASVPTHFKRADSHFSGDAISMTPEQSKFFYQRYKELVSQVVSLTPEKKDDLQIVMVSLQMVPLDF
jgi:uncharacterized protein (TIGR02147 family)